jgi:3-methyladenine DNA glycosylase AlkC
MLENSKDSGFSLKDELFNEQKVKWLANQFKIADKKFNEKDFSTKVIKELPNLGLKERIVFIAEVLESYLSSDFEIASRQIHKAMPPALDSTKTDDDFGDFIIAPLGQVVVNKGLTKQHLGTSLKLLKELTKRFSMEDAIRHFINAFPEETMVELEQWSTDDNYHVRRLVSEGTRPLLPWSGRVVIDQNDTISLLDSLHSDKTRYVTRSVANHLNDIAKINPSLVIKTLKRWHKNQKQEKKELDWMTRHSLRTLVKQGHEDALSLLGYHSSPNIEVSELLFSKQKLKIGETLEFSFSVKALTTEKILVDYVVDFIKKNGRTKPKVHKLKKLEFQKGEMVQVTKRHSLKKDATTVTFYPGKHTVTLQINGKPYSSADFILIK